MILSYDRVKKITFGFGLLMTICAVFMACYITNFYYSKSTVYAISDNVVTFESNGELFEWEFDADEKNNRNYSIGDAVTLRMSTGGTDDTRVDDRILEIEYGKADQLDYMAQWIEC